MEAFRSTLEVCGLADMGFKGKEFTWERGNFADTNIRERLDREVATQEWLNLFPEYEVQHFSHSFSNHCPVFIMTMPNVQSIGDPAQSSFVPRRLITDNVLLAYEILQSMKNKRMGKRGLMALKIDMSKTYDRVEWGFLQQMMAKMGFNGSWIQLIMRCISMVTYSVELNGKSGEIFMPGRGLRQGDPLSPFLFLIYRLCWRVGTGWNINIEEDVWAQDDEHLLIKKIVSNPDLLKVADLIDCTNRSWKTELIKGTFSEVDAQRILQISLARLPQDDFLAWRGEPTGEYTVRSGYRLLLHGNSINNNGYNPSENRKCYKNLWKSDLPSKLKITAWRATLKSNLRTKRLITDDVCPRCKQEVENRNHVFRDCTVSKETWNSLNFIWPVNLVDLEFMEWFTWIVSNSSMDICRSFLYTIWAIWLARNKWIH
ncbi:hypothetical protein PVK06_023320 [Gossypium arboreum]|uniref:Reverse transcriptase domain-containing protein n=1 Tax=Gossypium arboreum TaxID=29729 RepID=A0ABR0PB73_GOSAR|nr:hypothetical protein PVK06_023320 [Gossypium arboreum]